MSESEFVPTYDVGFKKPPKSSRFRKGVSGNPRGRPRGVRNFASILDRTLLESVVITENGARKTVTKLEAAVKQLVNRATAGDLVAMRQLISLASSAEIESAAAGKKSQLAEADRKIMKRLVEKLQKSQKGADNETDN
jgi:hypothetical protein